MILLMAILRGSGTRLFWHVNRVRRRSDAAKDTATRSIGSVNGIQESSSSMEPLNSTLPLWCLGGIHIAGLSSALLARFSHGTRLEGPSYRLFFGALAIVGATTMGSLELGHGCCLALGTTLLLMVLLVVWDVHRPGPVTLDR